MCSEELQDKLKDIYSEKAELCEKIDELEDKQNKFVRLLLEELRKIPGWEVLIQDCKYHYEQYPSEFFDWCYVYLNEGTVSFYKGYSDGDEYKVLEISLNVPLADQVKNKNEQLEKALNEKKDRAKKERFNTYLKLKEEFDKQ